MPLWVGSDHEQCQGSGQEKVLIAIGVGIASVELQDEDKPEAAPGCLSTRHSVNGAARESASCMMPLAGSVVNYGQETGVMTQVWELLFILLHGSVKCLSQANPVPGSILKKPKGAEMTHCSPSPSQGCPLAVPSHHPGPKRARSLPFSCSCPWLYGMTFKLRKILLEAG